jgi:RNA polymerase sigma-70 factor (ECF subfamily)
VVQEVFLQVVRKLDTFRGESNLATWLHHVTVNAVLAHRRKVAPQQAHEVRAPLDKVECRGRHPAAHRRKAAPDRQAIDREARVLIERAVARLPEMYREAFVLANFECLPNAEISAILGLSLPAVKSRLHRARLLLRVALGPHLGDAVAE